MYQSMLVRSNRSALATFSAIFALALAGGGLLIAPSMALAAATVTPVGNGTNISIDTSSAGVSPSWKSLGGPSFGTENGDISTGEHTISLPSGWEFDISSQITIIGTNDIEFFSNSITPDTVSFTFEVTGESTYEGTIIFGGLKVRPTGTTPSTGNMAYSGAGIVGVVEGVTNFGTLSTVAGTVTKLAFTAQPSATTVYGSTLSQQPVVKTQDQFGNNSISGLGTSNTVTLSLTSGSGSLTGTATADIGTSAGNGTATFSGLTVDEFGTDKQLTASATGLTPAVSASFEITKKPITATVTANDKSYDGTPDATIIDVTLNDVEVDDDVTVSNDGVATFASPDAGTDIVVTSNGVTITGDDIGNYSFNNTATGTADITQKPITVTPTTGQTKVYGEADTAFSYDFTPALISPDVFTGALSRVAGENVGTYAYTIGNLANGLDNYSLTLNPDTFEVTQRPLTVEATPSTKVYDGNTSSTGIPTITSGSLATGDDANFLQVYSTTNVATWKQLTPSGTAGGNSGLNYVYDFNHKFNGAITAKELIVSGLSVADRVYDGTTDTTVDGTPVLVDVVGADDVSLSGTAVGSFNTANVGSNTVAVTGLSLTGAKAGNYTLTQPVLNASITQLGITGSFTTENKVYNGNTTAAVLTQSLDGVLPADDGDVILTGGIANFADENVADGLVVTASDMTLSGPASGNYSLTSVSTETANITQKTLTATVTVQNKVVDGDDNSATILTRTPVGMIPGDDITLSGGVATFADAAVGNNKDVSVTGIAIASGNELGNYSYDGTATGTGNILPVPAVVYVDDNWAGTEEWAVPVGAGDATFFGYDAFATIQEAIDAVASSGTMNVASGTYDEQLQINKDITVSGATGTTVQPTGNDDAWDIQFTTGGSGATLEGFMLDFNGATNNRAGRGIAVSDLNGPTVTNVTIQGNDITMGVGIGAETGGLEGVGIQTGKNADVSGLQILNNDFHGGSSAITDGATQGEEGIYINPNGGTGTITVSDNTFDGELFTGISVEADNVTLNNNTVTRTSIVQNTNGIRVNDFVGSVSYDVTINENAVSNMANGIRLGSGSGSGSTLTISLTDNTISNNTRGVWVRNDAIVTAHENTIIDNTTEAELLAGSNGSLDATNNYWGTAVSATIDSLINGNVNFTPYYIDEVGGILSNVVPDEVFVDDNFTDGDAGDHIFGYDAFATIQEGIDAVASSGTVNVAAGTYEQGAAQISVNKSVTFKGPNSAISPNGGSRVDEVIIHGTASGATATFNITSGLVTVAFEGLKFENMGAAMRSDAPGATISLSRNIFTGAMTDGMGFDNPNLTVDDNLFTSVDTPNSDLIQLWVTTPPANTVSFTNNYFTSITSSGGLNLSDVSGTISGNHFDGVQYYGILVNANANLTISDNIFNNITNPDPGTSDTWGAGIRFYDGTNPSTIATITGNTFSNSYLGIGIKPAADITGASISANDNFFSGNTSAAVRNESMGTLDASQNWWGSEDGPTHTSNPGENGDAISNNVDYRPWYLTSDMINLDITVPAPTITSSSGSLTNDSPIPFSVNFGESVTGFELADITVGNGTPTPDSLVFTGTNYTFNVTPTGDGAVTVSIAAEKVWDASGNYNAGSNTSSVEYDSEAPTLTSVSISSSNADESLAKVGDTVSVAFTASEEIQTPNVTIAGHTGVGLANVGNDWTATYTMQESDTEGSVVFSITPTDVAGNAGTAVTAVSEDGGSVAFDKIAPEISIDSPDADAKGNGTAVIEFTTDDAGGTVTCSVNGGAPVTCVSGETTLANVTGFNGLGQVEFTLTVSHTDDAGNVGTASVALVKDTSAPMVDSHTPSVNAVNVETSTITVVFDEAVNVSTGQITLSPATAFTIGGNGTGTITLTTDPLDSNTVYTVTVTTEVKDLAGNAIAEAYDWSFTTATLYNVALNADNGGWNLISLPIVPVDTSISTVLGDAEDRILAVWTYDPTNVNADEENGGWFVYRPNDPTQSSLETMTAGYGYWISVTADTAINGSGSLLTAGPTTPPSVNLDDGWNLIGYYQIPGEDSSNMDDAFSSIGLAGTDYTALFGFNNASGASTNNVTTINPGDAFWISVSPNGGKNYTPSNL